MSSLRLIVDTHAYHTDGVPRCFSSWSATEKSLRERIEVIDRAAASGNHSFDGQRGDPTFYRRKDLQRRPYVMQWRAAWKWYMGTAFVDERLMEHMKPVAFQEPRFDVYRDSIIVMAHNVAAPEHVLHSQALSQADLYRALYVVTPESGRAALLPELGVKAPGVLVEILEGGTIGMHGPSGFQAAERPRLDREQIASLLSAADARVRMAAIQSASALARDEDALTFAQAHVASPRALRR